MSRLTHAARCSPLRLLRSTTTTAVRSEAAAQGACALDLAVAGGIGLAHNLIDLVWRHVLADNLQPNPRAGVSARVASRHVRRNNAAAVLWKERRWPARGEASSYDAHMTHIRCSIDAHIVLV